jgi:hypothetical protein
MKNKDLIFYAIVIFCIFLIFILIYIMLSEVGQCVKNPYIYGAKKMKNVSCYCIQENILCSAQFFFNTTTFINQNHECGTYDFENLELNV